MSLCPRHPERVPGFRQNNSAFGIGHLFGHDVNAQAVELVRDTLALKFTDHKTRIDHHEEIDDQILQRTWHELALKNLQTNGFG